MGRKRRRSQNLSGPDISQEKGRCWLGTVLVDLNRLGFSNRPSRQCFEKRKKWLISVFREDGCHPKLVEHHIPAIIDNDILKRALSISNARYDDIVTKQADRWPKLKLPDDLTLECLQGRLRVEAAKAFLPPGRRWWAIDLYQIR